MPHRSVSSSARIHRKPRSFWIKLLRRPGLASRLAAAQALANLGSEAGLAIPALIALLADPELRTRRRAYLALLRLGLEHGVLSRAAVAFYNEPSPEDECLNQWRLDRGIEPEPSDREFREERKPLLSAVRSADLELAECLEFFSALLADRSEQVRSLAALVLRGPWLPAPPEWLNDADGVNPTARRRAAHAAGGSEDGRGLATLAKLIRDPVPSVRQIAVVALGRLGAAALPSLAVALEDVDPDVRSQAFWALSRPLGPEAVGVLFGAMKHPTAEIRKDAVKAVDALGLLARDALPALEEARRDPDPTVASAASSASQDVSGRIHGKTLEHWAERLRDPRPRIRRNVARILVSAPRSDVIMEALTELVRDPDPDASRAACYAFEEGDLPLTHPAFLGLLLDPDPRHRVKALDILHWGHQAQSQTIVGQVLARLDDPDAAVRNRVLHRLARRDDTHTFHASYILPLREGSGGAEDESDRFARARAAAALGDWGDEGVTPLLAALRDPDVLVRRAAAVAIWRIGPAALEAARSAANDDDPDVRITAACFIGQHDPEALERLLPFLDDPSPSVSSTAIETLARFGPRAAIALPWLHNAVGEPHHPIVRRAVLAALGAIDPASPEVVRLMLRAISDPDPLTRTAVVEGLGAVNPDEPGVVQALAQALADPESGVRHAAVRSLGRIGPRAHAALGAMIDACSDPVWIVSAYARDNLVCLLPQDAEPAEVDAVVAVLTAALHSGDTQRRYWALESLSILAGLETFLEDLPSPSSCHRHSSSNEAPPPGPFPAAAKALATGLRHPLADVRRSVARKFSNGRDAAQIVLPELIEAYRADPDSWVRFSCKHALRNLGPAAAAIVPDLLAQLADPDDGVRFSAACDLAFIDPTNQAAAPILIAGLDDSNSLTRQHAAEALGRMGPATATAVAALRRLLEDPVPAVRRVTQNALEQIQGDPPSRVD